MRVQQIKPVMSLDRLVDGLLKGETDFRGVILHPGSDLSGHSGYSGLQDYLRGRSEEEWEANPVVLTGAELSGLIALGLHLPYANLIQAKLKGAKLSGANLMQAHLYEAILNRADLTGANLSRAYSREAKLREAVLIGAVLIGADLGCADIRGADVRGIDDLDKVIDIERAEWRYVRISPEQKEVVEAILARHGWWHNMPCVVVPYERSA